MPAPRSDVRMRCREVAEGQLVEGRLELLQPWAEPRGGVQRARAPRCARLCCVALTTLHLAVLGPVERAGHHPVACPQLVDVAGDLHPPGQQHDEVVADALEFGDHVRGEQHRDPVLGAGGEHRGQELASGQRVEVRQGLVQQQQLRPFGEHQGQRDLGPLPAGQRVDARPRRDLRGRGCAFGPAGTSKRGFMHRPSSSTSVPAVAATAARPARRTRSSANCRPGALPATCTVPVRRTQQSRGDVEQGRLAGSVRPDQSDHPPGRHLHSCSRAAPTGRLGSGVPTQLRANAPSCHTAGRRSRLGRLFIERDRHQHPDLLSLKPAARARRTQRNSESRTAGGATNAPAGGTAVTNVPIPCRRTTSPSCSSSAYAFTTVFGLIANASTTSRTAEADPRQPVARASPRGVPAPPTADRSGRHCPHRSGTRLAPIHSADSTKRNSTLVEPRRKHRTPVRVHGLTRVSRPVYEPGRDKRPDKLGARGTHAILRRTAR